MDPASNKVNLLMEEHRALMRQYGRTQSRCSALIERQAAELQALQSQAVRLRAAVVVRETALLWEREERADLEASIPCLPRRAALARRIDQLVERIQELMRERLRWQWRRPTDLPIRLEPGNETGPAVAATTALSASLETSDHAAALEASLVAADLVICQTGCLSHDAYWRVQDHCMRTGKACVVVARPEALRIVRIHEADHGDVVPRAEASQPERPARQPDAHDVSVSRPPGR